MFAVWLLRKSAAWSSSPGDYRDEDDDEEVEDSFKKFGGSLYKDDTKTIKTNSDSNSINVGRNRAKITNPKVGFYFLFVNIYLQFWKIFFHHIICIHKFKNVNFPIQQRLSIIFGFYDVLFNKTKKKCLSFYFIILIFRSFNSPKN